MSGTNRAAGTACACAGTVAAPAANGAPSTDSIGAVDARTAWVDDARTTTAGPATGAMVAVVDWFVVRLAPLLGIVQLPLPSLRRGVSWRRAEGLPRVCSDLPGAAFASRQRARPLGRSTIASTPP